MVLSCEKMEQKILQKNNRFPLTVFFSLFPFSSFLLFKKIFFFLLPFFFGPSPLHFPFHLLFFSPIFSFLHFSFPHPLLGYTAFLPFIASSGSSCVHSLAQNYQYTMLQHNTEVVMIELRKKLPNFDYQFNSSVLLHAVSLCFNFSNSFERTCNKFKFGLLFTPPARTVITYTRLKLSSHIPMKYN